MQSNKTLHGESMDIFWNFIELIDVKININFKVPVMSSSRKNPSHPMEGDQKFSG